MPKFDNSVPQMVIAIAQQLTDIHAASKQYGKPIIYPPGMKDKLATIYSLHKRFQSGIRELTSAEYYIIQDVAEWEVAEKHRIVETGALPPGRETWTMV